MMNLPSTTSRHVAAFARLTRWTVVVIAAVMFAPSMGQATGQQALGQGGVGQGTFGDAERAYLHAIRLLLGHGGDGGDGATPLLDREAWSRFSAVRHDRHVSDEIRADLARAAQVVALLTGSSSSPRSLADERNAAEITGADRYRGFAQIRDLLVADSVLRVADGDGQAAAMSLGSLLAMTGHVVSDPSLQHTLVGGAIGQVVAEEVTKAIGSGSLDAEAAQALLDRAPDLRERGPLNVANALEHERETLRELVMGRLDDPEADDSALMDRISTLDDESIDPFGDRPREDILRELDECDAIYAALANAARDPDPESAAARFAEIHAQVADGAGGVLGLHFVTHLETFTKTVMRIETQLRDARRDLRTLAGGTATANVANAAPLLRRAAEAALTIDEAEQALLETVRVAFPATDEELRDAARAIIARHATSILAPLREASAMGRCDFIGLERRNLYVPPGLEPYHAGLRGAVRVLLVDALLATDRETAEDAPAGRARQATAGDEAGESVDVVDPATSVESLTAALRVGALVSGDSALVHVALAHAIVADVRATAQELRDAMQPQKANELTAAAAIDWSSFRDTVAGLDRIDPLGHRRALDADHAVLVGSPMTRCRRYPRRGAAIRKLDPSAVTAIALIGLRPHVKTIEFGPMSTLADLVDTELYAALDALREQVWSAPIFTFEPERETEPLLGTAPLPAPIDFVRLAHDSSALIGSLDAFCKTLPR